MTDEDQPVTATVSVTMNLSYDFEIEPDDIPDGQTIEDVAFNRAHEKAIEELDNWPAAFMLLDDIEPVVE